MEAAPTNFISPVCQVTPMHPAHFLCTICGADYPFPGICRGYGAEKHEPSKVEKR